MRRFSSTAKSILSSGFQYATGSCRIALFMAAGDVLVQQFNGWKYSKQINWQRSLKFATIGLCFVGPVVTCWKNGINIILKSSQYHTTHTLKQLFWDQIYLAPCINLGIISMSAALEKESVHNIEKRISAYYPNIIKRHYMLWPGVQVLGSLCMKPPRQKAFAYFISIFWYAYLSGILHKDEICREPKLNTQN